MAQSYALQQSDSHQGVQRASHPLNCGLKRGLPLSLCISSGQWSLAGLYAMGGLEQAEVTRPVGYRTSLLHSVAMECLLIGGPADGRKMVVDAATAGLVVHVSTFDPRERIIAGYHRAPRLDEYFGRCVYLFTA